LFLDRSYARQSVNSVEEDPRSGELGYVAMIGWMKSGAHSSYSTIETCRKDVLQVPVSRGYLAKLCTGVDSIGQLPQATTQLLQLPEIVHRIKTQ